MTRPYSNILSTILISATLLAGCQSIPTPNMWPFPERELTTFNTPAMRLDAIKQFAMRSNGVDTPDQRAITDQLARQMQVEPDPLVRKAVIEAISKFKTPMSQQVLEAGLADEDADVRIACCRALGERAEPSSVSTLANVLRAEKNIDVRLAAAEALGNIKTNEAVQALVIALDDRDPAMQFVGVESMKSITGQDHGPDVEAWRTAATGGMPASAEVPSLAERLRRASPF